VGPRQRVHGGRAAVSVRVRRGAAAKTNAEGQPEWCVVGGGEIDYAGQFAALKADGFDGVVALETHWKGPSGDKEEASRLCLDGLKRLLEAAAG
jgi:sugar phosphate isomerase/epimerase